MENEKLTDAQLVYCRVILKSHPLFFNLSNEAIHEISTLFVPQSFIPSDEVAKEGDFVDSIYFIEKGIAEVRKNVTLPTGIEVVPMGVLRAQDAIGLSETGFYSSTGKRSATVVALSMLSTFRLDLKTFNEYIATRSALKKTFRDNSDFFLKANFIKATVPFDEISPDTVLDLAKKVEEKVVAADTIIIKQGDEGHTCYLLKNGQVEVSIKKDEGEPEHLAILEPPSVFGETAILMDVRRNATVKAITSCVLLVMDRETLLDSVHAESQAKQTLMTIISMRSRPLRHDNVKPYFTKTAEGDEIIILKDSKSKEYFRLTKEGWFVWQNLDGTQPLRDITMNFFAQFKIFNPAFASKLVSDLEKAGLVTVHNHHANKSIFQESKIHIIVLITVVILVLIGIGAVNWYFH